MPDITIPRNFLWLLAEFGNILPWNAETTGGTSSDGNPLVNVQWYDDKHEVCFLDYRDEVLTVGFNGACIDDYRVQYFALFGLAETYDAEWCDFDEPAVGQDKFDHEPLPDMGSRIRKGLANMAVSTYGELAALTRSEILATKYLGHISVATLRNVLASRDLYFRDDSNRQEDE